jgi:transposase-like protein
LVSYPLSATFVQPGEPLALLVDVLTRSEARSVAEVAAANDTCPARIYDLMERARRGLLPRPPGPVPGRLAQQRDRQHLEALKAQAREADSLIQQLRAQLAHAVLLDPRRLARLELVMAEHNVPFRAMHEILGVAFDGHGVPAVGTLHKHLEAHGDKARELIDQARAQVAGTLRAICGDDVFLQGVGVKVVTEPRSNAVLDVGRCPGRAAEDWLRWTKDFTGLELFISDLGTDLVGAIDARGLAQVIDYWHELDWWKDNLFTPIEREEAALARRVASGHKAMQTLHGEARRQARLELAKVERVRARYEREFYVVCEAETLLRALYQPLDPAGQLWTEASVAATIARMSKILLRITHPAGLATYEHVQRNAARYGTQRVLMDALPIEMRAGSHWQAREVLRALALERTLRQEADDMERPVTEQIQAERAARRLAESIDRHCVNAAEVRAQWLDLVAYPRRSSSGTESFNRRLRVLVAVQRFASDSRIALHAVAHNLKQRTSGPRRGWSPYQMLGIDFATPGANWYDVLLDAA